MKERFTSLYLVPTPIGNLKDITLRALEVLRSANLILAEDTRTTGKLLKHYDILTKQKSYHIHNEHKQIESLIERMQAGEQLALPAVLTASVVSLFATSYMPFIKSQIARSDIDFSLYYQG